MRKNPLAAANARNRALMNRIHELEQRQLPDRAQLNEMTTKYDRLARQVEATRRQNAAYKAVVVALAHLAHELLTTEDT